MEDITHWIHVWYIYHKHQPNVGKIYLTWILWVRKSLKIVCRAIAHFTEGVKAKDQTMPLFAGGLSHMITFSTFNPSSAGFLSAETRPKTRVWLSRPSVFTDREHEYRWGWEAEVRCFRSPTWAL